VLAARSGRALRREALPTPTAAANVLRKAIRLRELICRLCDAARRARRPSLDDMEQLNRFIKVAQRGTSIHWSGNTFLWDVPALSLDSMLPPLVRATAELLTSDLAQRIAQCQDETGCGWLFLDYSRSGARQWCSMSDCGNRAKARRHYRRTH
jgi:predicted RNA-binding Zn ribbon-like protein